MLHFLLFFLDFIVYAFGSNWLLSSLLVYFIYCNCKDSVMDSNQYFILFLLLIQDLFLYGRFGLGLVYIVPLLFVSRLTEGVFLKNLLWLRFGLLVSFSFFCEYFIIKKWLFLQDYTLESTFFRFLVSLLITSLILFGLRIFGTRGNRFLSHF